MQTTRLPVPNDTSPSGVKPPKLTKSPRAPGSLGLQLAMKCMEVAVSDCRLCPLGLEQIGLVAELEAPVNLLPSVPEGLPCVESGRVEAAPQECLKRIPSRVRLHVAHAQKFGEQCLGHAGHTSRGGGDGSTLPTAS